MAFKYFLVVCLSYYLVVSNVNCERGDCATVTTGFGPMKYMKVGTGSTILVLLDGTLGDIVADNFERIYNDFDHSKYTIYQVDLPGYGGSRTLVAPKKYSNRDFPPEFFERDADAVIQTMIELNVEKYSVLGWGYGGTVAMFVASRAPDNVVKCVSWAAKPFSSKTLVAKEKQRLKVPVKDWLPEVLGKQTLSHSIENIEEAFKGLTEAWESLLNSDNASPKQCLSKLSTPTLILYGKNDPYADSNLIQEIRNYAKNTAVILFVTKKHALHKLDKFAPAVKDFLDSNDYKMGGDVVEIDCTDQDEREEEEKQKKREEQKKLEEQQAGSSK
ncbi:valacyclovir hydrolase-like [Daktulosphaira vitifoliae]|uniref:valacyclovir hydrolase-like n=1 Tax=Daktulosphaira vitifoliae TaxID=58002 RepID=UPI0021A9AC63|nr:valacyclovir hydrolase-like [Daktulosphaira vitifoliae]